MSLPARRIRFQTDEDLKGDIIDGIRRRLPGVDLITAHEAGLLGQKNPEVLAYAAVHDRILLSHDKKTMPSHFYVFLSRGQQSPGVMLIEQTLPIRQIIDAVVLIWEASDPEEWRDRLTFLPL